MKNIIQKKSFILKHSENKMYDTKTFVYTTKFTEKNKIIKWRMKHKTTATWKHGWDWKCDITQLVNTIWHYLTEFGIVVVLLDIVWPCLAPFGQEQYRLAPFCSFWPCSTPYIIDGHCFAPLSIWPCAANRKIREEELY